MGGVKKNGLRDVFSAFNKSNDKRAESKTGSFTSIRNKRVDKSATHQASKRSGRGS